MNVFNYYYYTFSPTSTHHNLIRALVTTYGYRWCACKPEPIQNYERY